MSRGRETTLTFVVYLSPLISEIYPLVYLFSSPEHEVLMVSYCGQSMSVVRHAASTIALKAYSS